MGSRDQTRIDSSALGHGKSENVGMYESATVGQPFCRKLESQEGTCESFREGEDTGKLSCLLGPATSA